ncbi:Bug family tripartite tricarboxylate transporter substrate binding protein [Sediminicoccus rosea]|jgi:tripartite-type tricarboxylate transporter receptor subunit TctC|uniref:Tripartite tricarboxylate transporter substrate-binding protein n=1 Tax=Sediminicoccus rosea TaxID=1225128 RepID=A0ABZ0PE77_9PROT|nr:tripartite tricarboxylate transporter substrate-binding protein [Sediminicoccus rosea]WPB83934.1 tripartite tricarboxylate transporter substrate-binding protein [Sediminicoccus rosea]
MDATRWRLPVSRRAGLVLGAVLAAPRLARAQAFPSRPIRMVVPYPPGGGTDNLGRLVARALSDRLGQPVVVENRGGAGGNIGAALVATSPPDGYTLLFTGNGIAISDILFRNPGFDWKRDFVHITRIASTPMLLVVQPSLPVRNLTEFVAYARAHPGQLNHGTPGAGTSQHLAAALFDDMAGTRIVHVPYRGTGPSVAGLLSGEVQVMYASVSAVESLIRDGRIRALATTSGRRARAWPELPAIAEVLPGYAAELWYTLAAPARTPEAAITAIETAAREIMADQTFLSLIMERGFDPEFLDRAQLGPALDADAQRWGPALRRAGITAE